MVGRPVSVFKLSLGVTTEAKELVIVWKNWSSERQFKYEDGTIDEREATITFSNDKNRK